MSLSLYLCKLRYAKSRESAVLAQLNWSPDGAAARVFGTLPPGGGATLTTLTPSLRSSAARPPCGHIPTRSRRTALCCLRDAHPASSLIGRPSFIRIRDCWAGERMPLNSSTAPNVRGETLRAAPPTLRAPGRRWHPPHSRHSRSASPGGTLGR